MHKVTFQEISPKVFLSALAISSEEIKKDGSNVFNAFNYGHYFIDPEQYQILEEPLSPEMLYKSYIENENLFRVWVVIPEKMENYKYAKSYILAYNSGKEPYNFNSNTFYIIEPTQWGNTVEHQLEGINSEPFELGEEFTLSGWFLIPNMRMGRLYLNIDDSPRRGFYNEHMRSALDQVTELMEFHYQVCSDSIGGMISLNITDDNDVSYGITEDENELRRFRNWWLRHRINLRHIEDIDLYPFLLRGVQCRLVNIDKTILRFKHPLKQTETDAGLVYDLFPATDERPALQVLIKNKQIISFISDEFID